MKSRVDGKLPNFKKDEETISIIKALIERDIPVAIIAELYDVSRSLVYLVSYDMRRSSVPPSDTGKALRDISKRFQHLVEPHKR